jgi:hypothetical protein
LGREKVWVLWVQRARFLEYFVLRREAAQIRKMVTA